MCQCLMTCFLVNVNTFQVAPETFSFFFPERKLNSLYSEKIDIFKSAAALSNYKTGIKKEK